MTLELRVVTGARAGARELFDKPVVTVGRHPTSDFRFDPEGDLDVSARHAELRRVGSAWSVYDVGSTNGTYVNGERVTSERRLAAGDTIAFGAQGPTVEVRQRISPARRRLLFGAVGAAIIVALGVMGAVFRQQQAAPRAVPRAVPQPVVSVDLAALHARNDAAVAMIASDLDGGFIAGTAFGVSPSGLLVTNRHVVRAASGTPARRIRVIFANTTDWLPAHLVRTSDADDLALIQLDQEGRYPVVVGVSRTDSLAQVGAPIASIGYPLAVDTPMEGTGLHVTARTTTTAGTVSKRLDDVVQIDTYAGKGSSGSPVFDARGLVVGVIYGGAPESNGRIVYAVPARRLIAFLRTTLP